MITLIITGSLFVVTLITLLIVLFRKKNTDTINNKYSNLVKYSEEGGMAVIYKAFNKEAKRWCILKVLRQKQIHDRDAVESLFQEADILSKIKEMIPDANVPMVYDKGEIQDKFSKLPFIEIEYIKGKTSLETYLKKNGKLSIEEADDLIAKLLPAIKGAHKQKFIHRDIKPGNIMLRDGRIDQPVLIDFGIAKEEGGKKTETGLFLAPKYMAPEQADPNRPDLTIFVDNYILGILWYELLSGDVPFDDKNPLKLAEMHRTRDIKPFVENSVPKERQDIILKLLDKEPYNRPNVDEVARYLNRQIKINTEISSKNKKSERKKKSSNILVIILTVLLIILGGATLYFYNTGQLEDITNMTISNFEFDFNQLNASVMPIDPMIKYQNCMSFSIFPKFFDQIKEYNMEEKLCQVVQSKIDKNDPNRNFFIIDPEQLEIEDDFFVSKFVLVVDLAEKSVSIERDYKISLFYKKAIFAVKRDILQ